MIEAYVAWREACVDVQAAYERWAQWKAADRHFGCAGYLAALEHEELAADVYERQVAQVRRQSWAASGVVEG